LTVDFLIDEETRQWKEELVQACFRPADAEHIVKMPLSHNQTEDVASWPFTKSGIYTVKSAYIMEKRDASFLKASVKGKTERSDQSKLAIEWKKLWKIIAPPKMKIVLRRVAHDCLPTGQQLKNTNIPTQHLCCHCGRE
jgi:hypothetical protein